MMELQLPTELPALLNHTLHYLDMVRGTSGGNGSQAAAAALTTNDTLLDLVGLQPVNGTPGDYQHHPGIKADPICIILPITIFYCFIFVAGIVGNLAICIVIAKNRSMHTATNYYLFNLAVSDFLLLLFGE